MFDVLMQKYFASIGEFSDAMKLLERYEDLLSKNLSFEELELQFLAGLEEDEDELLFKAAEYKKDVLKSQKDTQERIKRLENIIDQLNNKTNLQTASVVTPVATNSPTLDTIIDTFVSGKKNSGVAKSTLGWIEGKLKTFLRVATEINNGIVPMVHEIDANLIRQYVELMQKYPDLNRNPMRTMSEKDRISHIKKYSRVELEAQGIKILSSSTIGDHFTMAKEFIGYLESQQYPIKSGLEKIIKPIGKTQLGQKIREDFSDDELKSLFENSIYTQGSTTLHCDYWVPLMALFSGATQGELLQLHVDDIRQEKGIWVIDINEKGEKTLKNKDGRPRILPIHKKLIDLGFIDFVKNMESKGSKRIFPEAERDKYNQFRPFSKRFATYRKKCGIKSDVEKKDFHSLRHQVIRQLNHIGCPSGIIDDIVGHQSKDRSEGKKSYKGKSGLEIKNDWLQKIKYDIDFSEYRNRNKVKGIKIP